MIHNSNIRDDAAINLLSSGGFRIGTAIKLVWGDVKELWSWDNVTPIHIGIESKRLKGEGYEGVGQHCFLTLHACKVLLKYADWYRNEKSQTSLLYL